MNDTDNIIRYIRGPIIMIVLLVIARYIFPNKMTFLFEVSTFGIYIIGNGILYNYMGMVSFGQPFYLGIGAYTSALYLAWVGNNIIIAIILAIVMGLVTGLLLGPAYIRLRGDYYALINAATCAMGLFLVEKIMLPITRGDDGLWFRSRMHKTPFLDLRRPDDIFWFTMIVLFAVLVFYTWLDRSSLGASLRGMKDNESKMMFLGYDTFKLRWTGYVMMTVLSALAGAMYAINYGFVNPSIAEPSRAAEVLVATLVGGGGVYGPIFGTLAFIGLKELGTLLMGLFGKSGWELPVGIFIIIVCFNFKGGVWGTLQAIGVKIKGKSPKPSV